MILFFVFISHLQNSHKYLTCKSEHVLNQITFRIRFKRKMIQDFKFGIEKHRYRKYQQLCINEAFLKN
jgi:hypothetical protein